MTDKKDSNIKTALNQLSLLLWKSFVIQMRSPISTILELVVPAFFALILLPIRHTIKTHIISNDTTFKSFSLDLDFPADTPVWTDSTFGYYPNTSKFVNDIMLRTSEKLNEFKYKSFKTEKEMLNFLASNYTFNMFGIGILNESISNFTYELRFSNSPRSKDDVLEWKDWHTEFIFPTLEPMGPRDKSSDYGGTPGYHNEGFLLVQKTLDFALISQFNEAVNKISINLKRFSYGPYVDDNFIVVLVVILPYIIQLSFMPTVILTTKAIVHEKETGLKEAMKLMGMKTWVYWLSWYIKTFIMLLPSLGLMLLSFKIKIPLKHGGSSAIIDKTDTGILAILLILYSSSLITFIMMSSTFFKKSNQASAGTGIIYFLTYIPHIYISIKYEKLNFFSKTISCFINNLALCLSTHLISLFEGTGTGVTFSNWTKGIYAEDPFSVAHAMFIMFLNNFIHLFVAYYFDNLMPGDHGIAKPWYFLFSNKKKRITNEKGLDEPLLSNQSEEDVKGDCYFEDESAYSAKRIGIKISKVFKVFKQLNGTLKKAVQNLSLNIYEEQITVLLGHNGAGKSTTISMITGLSEPQSGSILINGKDIVGNTKEARSVLGFCPQHNLLFEDLTVNEHLIFFSKLKQNYRSSEIDQMLNLIKLDDKKNSLAKTLSGGMKRKLSVAIAFIGGSKTVILDEPTSGMDPQARHLTWSILKKFKNERKCTILMTTHFMDEADYLGDRIAIMSKGSLRCCGLPLYLKSKYGSGYSLVLTRKSFENNLDNDFDDSKDKITDLVRSIIPNSRLDSNINSEMTFVLSSNDSDKFAALFDRLEKLKDHLNLINVGISATTIEQVFLKIEEDVDETVGKGAEENLNSKQLHQIDETGLWTGSSQKDLIEGKSAHLLNQFNALFLKRYIHTIRNKSLMLSQLLIPVCWIIINLLYIKYAVITPEDSPPLKIDLKDYGQNYLPYLIVNENPKNPRFSNELNSVAQNYREQMIKLSSEVKPFSLNETYVLDLCSDDRSSIEKYLSCLGRASYKKLNKEHFLATQFKSFNESSRKQFLFNITAHFNNLPYHVPPLAVNLVTNALLKYFTNSSKSSITCINRPLPKNYTEKLHDSTNKNMNSFRISSALNFGLSFLVASFSIFLIKENASGAKHLQFLNSCNYYIFWLSSFVWDFINFVIPMICCFVLLIVFDAKGIFGGIRWLYSIIILILYGLSHILQTYLLSLCFKIPSSGFAAITGWNIFSSQIALIVVRILTIPNLGTTEIADYLQTIFSLFLPSFAMGQSMIDMTDNFENLKVCGQYNSNGTYDSNEFSCRYHPNPCCRYYKNVIREKPCGSFDCFYWNPNYWAWQKPGLLRYILFMLLQILVELAVLILIENSYLRKMSYIFKRRFFALSKEPNVDLQIQKEKFYGDIEKDTDVIEEEHRVSNTVTNNNCTEFFAVDKLVKHYSNAFVAVKGVSFGINSSECFGLLGVNGAGKTSTFKMITGDEYITKGDVYLNNSSIKSDLKNFQKQIGYCPQSDPLIDQMTVLETMIMYSRIRGIKNELVLRTSMSLIELLDLMDHKDKMCFTLSGGNKRKLSVAIALVGSPAVILLDEPTSGMDPKTRRRLWDCLNKIRNKGKSLILTTHSMDETEALCTKITIMVNGEFKCIGSLQHLQSRYGDGYTLLIKLDCKQKNNLNEFISFIFGSFENTVLKENRDGFLNFHLQTNSMNSLAKIFSLIEKSKAEYAIEYYGLTQTKLEQIFLNFASHQIDYKDQLFLMNNNNKIIAEKQIV